MGQLICHGAKATPFAVVTSKLYRSEQHNHNCGHALFEIKDGNCRISSASVCTFIVDALGAERRFAVAKLVCTGLACPSKTDGG
jgi:hypothetical protein